MLPSEFLDKQKLVYKISSSDQFAVEVCPACGDSGWHFYMHQELGLWNCKKCHETGNLWTLRALVEPVGSVTSVSDMLAVSHENSVVNEDLITEYINALMKDQTALRWLLDRGFTKETVHKFRLGLVVEGMTSWLTIPFFKNRHPVNVKYRALPPHEKTFRVIQEHDTPLFNIDNLNPKEPVFVTEGEFDAMMLVQQGYENTVSIPLGAGTFLPEHFDSLVECGKIYLCYDSDKEGKKGALAVADRLGPERCFYVKLPVKDVNDFFLRYSKADFEGVLGEAKSVGRSAILSVAQTFDELEASFNRKSDSEVKFPWPNVNRVVGALEPGWIVVLQAIPKVGKTTFCTNTCYDLASKGLPCLLYCLEMSPIRLLKRAISSLRQTPVPDLTDTDIIMAKSEMYQLPLYFGRATSLEVEKVFNSIRYAVKRFGIRLVIFDHLHFLCRDIAHSVSEVGKVMRDFKMLFEELGIPGIVVVHPKKMSVEEMPGMYAARESGEIPGDADVLISLFRKSINSGNKVRDDDFVDDEVPTFEARTLVKVIASRFGKGGHAVLYFNGNSMQFQESLT